MAKRKRASSTHKPPPSPPISSSLHNPSADTPSSLFYSSFLRSPNNHKLLGFALVVLSPCASPPFRGSSAVPSNGSDDSDMVNSENGDCFVDDFAKRSRADLFSSRVLDKKGENSHGLGFEFEAQAGSPLGKKLEALVGAECVLEGKGSDVCVRVEDGTALYAIHLGYDEDLGCEEEDSVLTDLTDEPCRSMKKSLQDPLRTPESKLQGSLYSNVLDLEDGSALSDYGLKCSASVTPKQSASMILKQRSPSFTFSGRKTRKRVSMGSSIIYQMHKLSVQNDVKIQGWVVKSSEQERDARVVVLLDVLLPDSLWSTHNYWKASPQTATALIHLSCDWKCRNEILESADLITGNNTIPGTENIWHIGACNVLGCKMHMKSTERFDLHDIFSCLSKQDPEAVSHRSPIQPDKPTQDNLSGFWDLSNDVLIRIFSMLSPKDLLSISAVCRQTRIIASAVIPCMNLNLFPHQRAAVCWMLNREANPQVLLNPVYQVFKTDDGFYFYLNTISGEISLEMPPEISDFRGGLFCDEPGLGKTVTALALILKTQGILSQPPPGIKVSWCKHSSHGKVGYYEVTTSFGLPAAKRCSALKAQRFDGADCQSKRLKSCPSSEDMGTPHKTGMLRKKLFHGGKCFQQDNPEKLIVKWKSRVTRSQVKASFAVSDSMSEEDSLPFENSEMKSDKMSECWVQCDACTKWRKLFDWQAPPKEGVAWFCSMNVDTEHQNCSIPEESWDKRCKINSLPGFVREDGPRCDEKNVKFFTDELKLRANIFNIEAKRALNWLANLSPIDLRKLVRGISVPHSLRLVTISGSDLHYYDKFFQAFGLVQFRDRKGGAPKWCYPTGLNNLVFDVEALKVALSKPVQEVTRMYLSRATLIVVPSNLVEHWKVQITKHTKHNQLKWHVWTDQKSLLKPHILAWDYDIVITTFPRLSAEWSSRESSVLMQIHWFRIILDEGHTLGVSLSLTNKLQMAVSMCASRRWVLTGTPLPDTPTNQVVHLQPILRFLHDEVYGQHVKLWESAILRPFESGCEIGRVRLLQLLQRCMISARKADLHHIPPCIRKMKLLDFTEKHAATYNELVVTVRRNILMADWNDPDHIESLLNPKQWKLRSTTVRNVRLSCCVAGHIKVRNAGEDIKETMDILIEQGMDPNSAEYDNIRDALFWGGNCKRCNEWCRLPILTPCVHLLCLSCVAIDREKCPLTSCGHPYKMQMPEDMTRPENPNPKWPVPQDLIELQPSYVQENWHPDWQATSSSKVAYLIEQLKDMNSLNAKKENPIDDFHLASIMYEPSLQRRQDGAPEKAIVFSQFLEHISAINMQLTLANINHVGMYSPMPAGHKMKSLKTFQDDPNCVVLVMDGTAALGLDLSFVTRVYLMEPIWDRSLEEQVVSRAHRMGATRPVLVETLAMRGTIEEQMLNFLQGPVSICSPSDKLQRKHHLNDHEPAEGWYLEHLSFVKTDRNLVSTNEVLPLI